MTAIDNKNKEKVKDLYKENIKNNIEEDIVYEMYKNRKLNSERFQFIIDNCTDYLNISSFFVKEPIFEDDIELLEVLFNNLKFFDNRFIINLLNYYNNKTPISNAYLYPLINNDKFKILTKKNNKFFRKNKNRFIIRFKFRNYKNSSIYPLNACENGNKAALKYFVELGFNIKNKAALKC